MFENWRVFTLVLLLTLSVLDLVFTFFYVTVYKHWQPFKPYNLIELNPLLVFLWNKFGLYLGMLIGSVIILSLMYLIGKEAHWIIIVILLIVLCFEMFNHWNNIHLLWKLMEQYPSGFLPESIFGIVVGNNPKERQTKQEYNYEQEYKNKLKDKIKKL